MAQPNSTPAAPAIDAATTALTTQIELLVSLHLWAWPALKLAIENAWGGSAQASEDKREWFAGAVSELLTSPETPAPLGDVADLEEVLLQVMVDEFEVVVDDGSAEDTARDIWAGVARLRAGDVAELNALHARWREGRAKGAASGIVRAADQEADDTEWDDSGDDEEWNGFPDRPAGGDVEMGDAPPLVDVAKARQKVEPEVDEDGFTKVVGKKKR